MNDDIKYYCKELEKLRITYTVFEHPRLVSPEEVQKYLHEAVGDCIAALVFKADKDFIVLLKKGDDKVDLKKLKKLLKVNDLRFANKEEFENITGLPFGAARMYIPGLATYIDEGVFIKEYLNGGTGSFVYTFKYKTADVKKIPQSQIVNVTMTDYDKRTEKRVLSGIRATGRLHLGNYLGAIKGMLALQDDPSYETFYMVADLHSITTPYNVEELRKNRREVIIDYLAAGLDPQKSILFQQAANPYHAELAFYLSSVVTIAKMQHLPTFKDKVKQHPQHATMALLNYPVLMTADILAYKASEVPVGIDQEPHLEVAREIARRMNQDYGTDFPEPRTFKTTGKYVPSLTGEGKMSKSVEGSYINLTDDLETIKAKIAKFPTDSGKGQIKGGQYFADSDTPSNGVKNLLDFIELFEGKEKRGKFDKNYQESGLRYSEVKNELAEAIYKELKPIQEKRKALETEPGKVNRIIEEGNEKARAIARETVKEVRETMGLL